MLNSEDIRRIIDEHCQEFYQLEKKDLKKSNKLSSRLNLTNQEVLESVGENKQMPLKEIQNLK